MVQYRATTMAMKGMVTSPHYLASQAGLSVLKEGGNAIEAAIAMASTIAVVYPHMNGIGGDNFWLIYNANNGVITAINGSGRSGERASIEFYRSKGYETIPARGPLAAITVPGAVRGWNVAYQYGQDEMGSTMPWHKLLEQAIAYAKEGFPVTPSQHTWTKVNLDEKDQTFRALNRFEEFSRIFLKDGKPYKVGDIFIQEDLAHTLELIAQNGADYFYDSELTERLVEDLQKHGGILTKEDFQKHTSDLVEPISVPYRNFVAYNLPPNTQGLASLSILNILNQLNLAEIEEGSAQYYHLLAEAIKHAFRDRDKYLTDPTYNHIPLNELLSKERGVGFAEKIKESCHATALPAMDPKGDTVWFAVVDEKGNAVSCIQSIYHEFGSAFIPKGTGVLLQNRGSFFSLDDKHVNSLQPRKRSFHTLNSAMLMKDNRPVLIYGTMGGEGQPQTQTLLATRIIDYGMNVQEAIEAPRFLYGRTWGATTNTLKVESRIPKNVQKELERFGHEVEVVEEFSDLMGHAGAIYIDEKGVKYGGADPRGDGIAIGY
ncbi:gamma-glutamyltransferase [Ureibacillus sp. FSL K6-0786]|uniref:gamma-glutamyltransferase n=1 Tax=Ureibacillus sp. FSL K6-0786 TaxID=2954607 RepID=UPI0030D91571